MQDFKKDMKEILFHVLEFQIAQGATFSDSQLAPSKFNPSGASGQLLISNTANLGNCREPKVILISIRQNEITILYICST